MRHVRSLPRRQPLAQHCHTGPAQPFLLLNVAPHRVCGFARGHQLLQRGLAAVAKRALAQRVPGHQAHAARRKLLVPARKLRPRGSLPISQQPCALFSLRQGSNAILILPAQLASQRCTSIWKAPTFINCLNNPSPDAPTKGATMF